MKGRITKFNTQGYSFEEWQSWVFVGFQQVMGISLLKSKLARDRLRQYYDDEFTAYDTVRDLMKEKDNK